jgi:signal transduction histidine kinase
VQLRYGYEMLELEVVNEPALTPASTNGSGAGHGLVGMRERVRLFDGSFDAQALGNGGFRVHAALPLNEDPA